jgi:Ni/Co efflux regulator RcnB
MTSSIKKILIASAAVFAIGMPMAANAAPPKSHTSKTHATSEKFTTGAVSAWTPDSRMLKLVTGDEFKVGARVKAPAYKAGDTVTVRWTIKDGAKIADKVDIK